MSTITKRLISTFVCIICIINACCVHLVQAVLYSRFPKALVSRGYIRFVRTNLFCLYAIKRNMKYNYIPSIKELSSSLKCRSKEYFLENSLHGVPYFVDPGRPKWERITWFILTLASVFATFAVIMTVWDKFQTELTITAIDLDTMNITIDFPQVYICYDWNELNRTHFTELPQSDIYQASYTWKRNTRFDNFDEAVGNINNLRQIYAMSGPDCASIFDNCAYREETKPCGNFFKKIMTPSGVCCKFNASEPLGIADYPEFTFETSVYPWRLYILQKTDSSPRRVERELIKAYFPIRVEFDVDVTYTTPYIQHYSRQQRQCHFPYEEMSLDDCEMHCAVHEMFDECNCLPWFVSSHEYRQCSISEYNCVQKAMAKFNYVDCGCTLGCDHTSYKIDRVTRSERNNNIIILKNWPTAIYRLETRFGFLDLLVSFGGIASLFLGYSLLTTVEMVYYFSLRAYCGAVVESSRNKHNIVTIRVIEAKPPRKVDVNPIYYPYLD